MAIKVGGTDVIDNSRGLKNIATVDATTATAISAAGVGGIDYVVKTANYTTQSAEGVLADTSGGAFTVTLPATPSAGDYVIVADPASSWGTNNLTVGRNGSTIADIAQDLVCDISGVSVELVYDGSTWSVYTQVGGNGLSLPVTVAQGGTGATSLSANNVILGNGTSAVQTVAPGTSGNILTSNGTTWTSAAATGGVDFQEFTSSGTWTKPSGVSVVLVECFGAGAGGGSGEPAPNPGNTSDGPGGGGGGAYAFAYFDAADLGSTVTVTVGAGGAGGVGASSGGINNGSDGGDSQFGSHLIAGGGSGNSAKSGGAKGKLDPLGNAGTEDIPTTALFYGGDGGNGKTLAFNTGEGSIFAGAGGGAGGRGGNVGTGDSQGYPGGGIPTTTGGAGGDGSINGDPGSNGSFRTGGGGGSGARSYTGPGGDGGNGGIAAGGGGGGGGYGDVSGSGGDGGDGYVRVTSW